MSEREDALASARRAQQRVWDVRRSGAAADSPEARQAVNALMGRLRALSPEELAAFEAWRAAAPPPGTD